MPLLDATDWNDFQVSDATNEKRFSELGLVNAVKDSTASVDYIPPSAKAALASASSLRNVQIPVLKDQQVKVVLTPGFQNIPSNLPESDKYQFAAVDVFTGFRHYPAQYDNNMIDGAWAKNEVMKNVSYAAGNTIEGIIAAQLETRKTQLLGNTTQVSQGDGTYAFDAASDTLEISKAAQKEAGMFFYLQHLMESNELAGNYRLVVNRAGLAVQKAQQLMYKKYNEKDLAALGTLPNDRMYESGNIAADGDIFNGWFFRDGSIGMIENFPYDFRNGTTIGGRKWSISDVEIPNTRLRANIFVNNEATEATALVGAGTDSNLIMTHFSEMAMWFRFYIVYRYNSNLAGRVNDIVKIKGLTT